MERIQTNDSGEIVGVSDEVVDFIFASGKICERRTSYIERIGVHDWDTKYNKPLDHAACHDDRRIPLSRQCCRCGKREVYVPAKYPDEWQPEPQEREPGQEG